jgi:amidase
VCLVVAAAFAVTLSPRAQTSRSATAGFTVVEASIADMLTAMEKKRVTSRQIVTESLARIATYEDRLNAVITVNPKALEEADERDRERAAGRVRGRLHGIPIALKDNIHTTNMPTTGGALAFDGFVPPYEATLTANLRAAGAVIIAKTGLTELANWVTNGMPGNYNGLTGYGMNPYDPRRDPRAATGDGRPVMSPVGSSSGIGTSVSFWAANVGTETSGSILSPSNATMLVGVKPTVGRISRYGVIPITADRDTPGPMARSVMDAAILLGALEGAAPDPNDPATRACMPPPGRDYTRTLRPGALKGARIGIPRDVKGGPGQPQRELFDQAIDALRRGGAVLVDPASIPSIADGSFGAWGICAGAKDGENCSVVFKYGMKRDFNAWLASLGPTAPVKTLSELIAWNAAHKAGGSIKYGQTLLEASDQMDLAADRARYEADRAKDVMLAATHGIDEIMKAERLDALLFPGAGGAVIGAKAGYPSVIVPIGLVPANAAGLPAGFQPKPQPYGVMFTGMACSEPRLLEIAYAFEQATKKRVPPPGF